MTVFQGERHEISCIIVSPSCGVVKALTA